MVFFAQDASLSVSSTGNDTITFARYFCTNSTSLSVMCLSPSTSAAAACSCVRVMTDAICFWTVKTSATEILPSVLTSPYKIPLSAVSSSCVFAETLSPSIDNSSAKVRSALKNLMLLFFIHNPPSNNQALFMPAPLYKYGTKKSIKYDKKYINSYIK